MVDEIKMDATCSELKDKGYSYKGSKGSKLTIKNYKQMDD
jgi:hypothetical protein